MVALREDLWPSPGTIGAEETSMDLDQSTIATFCREGWLLLPGALDRASCDAVIAAGGSTGSGRDFWTPKIWDIQQPDAEPELHRLLVDERIAAIAGALLEEAPRVFYGMLAVVPPGGGRGLPWHADNMYSKVYGRALNCFIALGDIAEDMANLWVAPRSHRWGTAPGERSEQHHGHMLAVQEPENGMPLPPLRAGDVCVFDRDLLHRSLRNDSDRPRHAYAAQFCAASARMVDSGERPDKPLVSELAARWSGRTVPA